MKLRSMVGPTDTMKLKDDYLQLTVEMLTVLSTLTDAKNLYNRLLSERDKLEDKAREWGVDLTT